MLFRAVIDRETLNYWTMAELRITERQVGDVTILDLDGKITIGEGSVIFRETIRRLIDENKKKVVLNYAEVGYQDSSGNGELFSTYTTIVRAGGRICIANLTQKLQDLLTITKILTAFDAFESVDEAVNHLSRPEVLGRCPVHGCGNLIRFPNPGLPYGETCTKCRTQLFLQALPNTNNQALIKSIRLPTYEGEYISVTPGEPTSIRVVGRLDLFASEELEKAWHTVLPPRCVIFDLTACDEISQLGTQRISTLCANSEERSVGVILIGSQNAVFPSATRVFRQQPDAIAALGNIPVSTKWTLDLKTNPG